MTISSYVVFPTPKKFSDMIRDLKQVPNCEVFPANNRQVAVVVTETSPNKNQEDLQEKLQAIDSVQCLSLAWAEIPEEISGGM